MSVSSPDDDQAYPHQVYPPVESATAHFPATDDAANYDASAEYAASGYAVSDQVASDHVASDYAASDYAESIAAPIDSAETVAFLRRLSSFISVGQNAANLQQAATLIEVLGERVRQAEDLLLHRDDQAAVYVDMCKAYEVMLDRLQSENAALNAKLSWQMDDAAKARADLQSETERLSAEVARARVEQANAMADLEELRTSLSSLGDSAVIMPVATLNALGIQFEVLSNQFARNGDLISQVMSEIGRCAIDQVMITHSPEPVDATHMASDIALAPDLLRVGGI